MKKRHKKSVLKSLPKQLARKPLIPLSIVFVLVGLAIVVGLRSGTFAAVPGLVNPTHLVDTIWNLDAQTGYSSIEVDMKIEVASGDDGYYFSNTVNFANYPSGDNFAYAGLQSGGNNGQTIIGKMAIFSVWDVSRGIAEPGGWGLPYDHEGSGYSVRIPYNWSTGVTYRIRIYLNSDATSGDRIWAASVTNLSTGQVNRIGRIYVPAIRGNIRTPITFHERFSGPTNTCSDIDPSQVVFSNMTANNGVIRATTTDHYYKANIPACAPNIWVQNLSPTSYRSAAGIAPQGPAASLTIQSAPSTVVAGSNFGASITARNNGVDPWTSNQGYKLGSQTPENNSTWGTGRIDLPSTASIQSGESHTFSGSFKAPTTPGTYTFSWKMLREGVTWFGETASKTIQVAAPTTPTLQPDLIVTDIAPLTATVNQQVLFKATIKNQGTGPTPANTFHGVAFRVNGTLISWSDDYNNSLAAGASVTVTANGGLSSTTWTPTTAGTATVEAFIDDINRIPNELDETNNKLTRTISVSNPSNLPGDVDGNGMVNGIDLSTVLTNYGKTGQTRLQGDLDGNGTVNGLDLSAVLTNYGK